MGEIFTRLESDKLEELKATLLKADGSLKECEFSKNDYLVSPEVLDKETNDTLQKKNILIDFQAAFLDTTASRSASEKNNIITFGAILGGRIRSEVRREAYEENAKTRSSASMKGKIKGWGLDKLRYLVTDEDGKDYDLGAEKLFEKEMRSRFESKSFQDLEAQDQELVLRILSTIKCPNETTRRDLFTWINQTAPPARADLKKQLEELLIKNAINNPTPELMAVLRFCEKQPTLFSTLYPILQGTGEAQQQYDQMKKQYDEMSNEFKEFKSNYEIADAVRKTLKDSLISEKKKIWRNDKDKDKIKKLEEEIKNFDQAPFFISTHSELNLIQTDTLFPNYEALKKAANDLLPQISKKGEEMRKQKTEIAKPSKKYSPFELMLEINKRILRDKFSGKEKKEVDTMAYLKTTEDTDASSMDFYRSLNSRALSEGVKKDNKLWWKEIYQKYLKEVFPKMDYISQYMTAEQIEKAIAQKKLTMEDVDKLIQIIDALLTDKHPKAKLKSSEDISNLRISLEQVKKNKQIDDFYEGITIKEDCGEEVNLGKIYKETVKKKTPKVEEAVKKTEDSSGKKADSKEEKWEQVKNTLGNKFKDFLEGK